MRNIAIGDIHGGLRALKQLLEKIQPTSSDTFVFLGDYVDGWSESVETVAYLMEFSEEFESVLLMGNHDELLLKYIEENDNNPMWLAHGGATTKAGYDQLSSEEIARHIQFIDSFHPYYIDSENRLFCHAGFTNMHGPQFEYYKNMTYWDRTLWEMVYTMDPEMKPDHKRYPKRLKLFKEIYIGHTPVTRIGKKVPVNFANLWNVDTGAAFKGPLSAIDIDTKEIWQSDPVWTLYPGESGRN